MDITTTTRIYAPKNAKFRRRLYGFTLQIKTIESSQKDIRNEVVSILNNLNLKVIGKSFDPNFIDQDLIEIFLSQVNMDGVDIPFNLAQLT